MGLQTRVHEKLGVRPPRNVDVSGSRGLSAQNIFLFLEGLPAQLQHITLDSVVVKDPAFIRFLEGRLKAAGKGGSALNSVAFAEESLSRLEAPEVFPLLLPLLEHLCLKGNILGRVGCAALGEAFRSGRASRLRTLDLEETGIDWHQLNILLQAFRWTWCPTRLEAVNLYESLYQLEVLLRSFQRSDVPVLLENLNLSGNPLGDLGMNVLSRLLYVLWCRGARVRVLKLRRCECTEDGVEDLARVIRGGWLSCLETLDLEDVARAAFFSSFAEPEGKAFPFL
uniref:Uncharacterized protein n=1 Tax=Chromera velia CCMP2878 TaxID=1169474 RepID=A0A0G4G2X3_9ALVE|eukprot:Cvel_19944.t1-p1 / transcript=Cvel_19944.t1 / gene=Cvel_19944 / organism=Chromera_velia_CCMP2878 / gene_product=hypothetical protein / transcript_product=hypothetical protein / location=Cvel_scaffold1755:4004-8886(-) / protein_length=281 / sequence_SO=supercontig / SO=protein_coding / is_pseudo=false